MKLNIDTFEDRRVILAVSHKGREWEIDVRIDEDGIIAEIGRDSVLCTSCEFGWDDRHENEPQTASNRPGDQAAVMHEETGIDYERCLVMCNMD
jgi:hypothetical protein